MPERALELRGLQKRFGAVAAVDGIDLIVEPGEFVTLLGPSGCGKTTTLNLIAGFLPPSAGSIVLGGVAVEGLPPYRRDLGVVFQDYALFPHLSVAENVAFGLRMRRIGAAEIATRVREALALVKLEGLGDRRPAQLSGGQRQRVALARALVIRPRMLLLDEPLSNLDLKLREEMRVEIRGLQQRLAIATIFVTHDQGEALAMSDRIAVMNAGRIEQVGTPHAIYEAPRSRFVAEFIGATNIIAGTVQSGPDRGGLALVQTALGGLRAGADAGCMPGAQVTLALRPERVRVRKGASAGGVGATVVEAVYLGSRSELAVKTQSGVRVLAESVNDGTQSRFAPGDEVSLVIEPGDCRVLSG